MPDNQSGNYGSRPYPMPEPAYAGQADGVCDVAELFEGVNGADSVIDASGRIYQDNTPDAHSWEGGHGQPGTRPWGGDEVRSGSFQDDTFGSFGYEDGRPGLRVSPDSGDGDYDGD